MRVSVWPANQLAIKRLIDTVLACVLVVALLPVMIVIGIAVKATSPGEIIFRQQRAGRGGRPFTIYKFRTMTHDRLRSSGTTRVYEDDPRITHLGKMLRRTGLDELPQIVNVLLGDMSFVGPRPDLLHHAERYTREQRRRLEVRPGITGWAQVAGRNDLSWEERIALDIEYLQDWSLRRDIAVVTKTAAVLLSGKGAALPKPVEEVACDEDQQTS
jgi:lipopolysaccharide/colanic/teichoic acid biosynthesis glycosyltransferase